MTIAGLTLSPVSPAKAPRLIVGRTAWIARFPG